MAKPGCKRFADRGAKSPSFFPFEQGGKLGAPSGSVHASSIELDSTERRARFSPIEGRVGNGLEQVREWMSESDKA